MSLKLTSLWALWNLWLFIERQASTILLQIHFTEKVGFEHVLLVWGDNTGGGWPGPGGGGKGPRLWWKQVLSQDKFKLKIFWILSPTSCFLSHFGELSNNELKNVLLVRLEWDGWPDSDLGGVAGEPAPLSSLSPLVSSPSSFLILVLTLISSSSLFSGLPERSSPGPSSGAFVMLLASLSSTALSLFRLLSFPVKINRMSHF